MKQGLHVLSNGSKFWYKNNYLHRLDGPAIIGIDKSEYWYKDGQRHRSDGPAIIYPTGEKFWYINGNCVAHSELEFNNYLIDKNLKSLL